VRPCILILTGKFWLFVKYPNYSFKDEKNRMRPENTGSGESLPG
jgi:hypothetical protein